MDARPGGFGPPVDVARVVPSRSQPAPPLPPAPGSPSPRALDAVEEQLARLRDLAIADHVGIFAAVHQQLTDALAVTGGGQGSGNQSSPAHPSSVQPSSAQRGR